MEQYIEFNIYNMHCNSCVARIEKLLTQTSGVLEARVNFQLEQGSVTYDNSKVTPDHIFETVKKAGYTTSPLIRE